MPDTLLDAVKNYMDITWEDPESDKKLQGIIARGKVRLEDIAGAPLDFNIEDEPRGLLMDYCRYAMSNALEVFEKNFQSQLISLNLNCSMNEVFNGN